MNPDFRFDSGPQQRILVPPEARQARAAGWRRRQGGGSLEDEAFER